MGHEHVDDGTWGEPGKSGGGDLRLQPHDAQRRAFSEIYG